MTTEEQRLAAWLHAETPEPPRAIAVADIADRVAAGRRRRALRWLPPLAAAAVVVLALALTWVATRPDATKPADRSVSPGPLTSPSTSSAPHLASVPPSPDPLVLKVHPWDATALSTVSIAANTTLVVDKNIYVVMGRTHGLYQDQLLRLDLGSGNIARGSKRSVDPLVSPVAAGGLIWAAGQHSILGFDPTTLKVREQHAFSGTDPVLTSAGSDLVLGVGTRVITFDTTGAVSSFTVAGTVTGVAVDPAGTRMYVAIRGATGDVRIEVHNPTSGAVIGSPTETDSGGVGGLVATSGGLWYLWASGNGAAIQFLPSDGRPAPELDYGRSGGGIDVTPALSGGVMWIGGLGTLACADPDTGRVLSQTAYAQTGDPEYISGIRAIGRIAYALIGDLFVRMTPPKSCFG